MTVYGRLQEMDHGHMGGPRDAAACGLRWYRVLTRRTSIVLASSHPSQPLWQLLAAARRRRA